MDETWLPFDSPWIPRARFLLNLRATSKLSASLHSRITSFLQWHPGAYAHTPENVANIEFSHCCPEEEENSIEIDNGYAPLHLPDAPLPRTPWRLIAYHSRFPASELALMRHTPWVLGEIPALLTRKPNSAHRTTRAHLDYPSVESYLIHTMRHSSPALLSSESQPTLVHITFKPTKSAFQKIALAWMSSKEQSPGSKTERYPSSRTRLAMSWVYWEP